MNTFNYLLPFAINFIRYFLIAGLAFLFVYRIYKISLTKSKIQEREVIKRHILRDILFSLQTIVVFGCVSIVIMVSPLREYTSIYRAINTYTLWWIPTSIFLALLVHDTYFYWMHRVIHHPRLFKYLHLTHHKSTNPTPWTSYTFGLTEAILEALIIPVMLSIIPMHPLSIFIFSIVAFSINVYGHLGYETMPKKFRTSWLFQIINTSVHHNLHHEKFNGNYGLYFRFWDRLMNTENPDYEKKYDQIQTSRFAIEANATIQVNETAKS